MLAFTSVKVLIRRSFAPHFMRVARERFLFYYVESITIIRLGE